MIAIFGIPSVVKRPDGVCQDDFLEVAYPVQMQADVDRRNLHLRKNLLSLCLLQRIARRCLPTVSGIRSTHLPTTGTIHLDHQARTPAILHQTTLSESGKPRRLGVYLALLDSRAMEPSLSRPLPAMPLLLPRPSDRPWPLLQRRRYVSIHSASALLVCIPRSARSNSTNSDPAPQ